MAKKLNAEMTETRTYYMIQMSDELGGMFGDMPGMPNGGRGYNTPDEARTVYTEKYQPLERNLGPGRFRIVERVVTDTPITI